MLFHIHYYLIPQVFKNSFILNTIGEFKLYFFYLKSNHSIPNIVVLERFRNSNEIQHLPS